ncbi:putative insertion sequence transposase protein [Roseobacter sp. SK209-2-6]|nr:putative insertion sequence transposase protein [Roseobacter sp. SK209-2-6]
MSKIAAEIGRHRSTVYREIKRNYFSDEELPYLSGYYGMNAQKYASAVRHKARGKPPNNRIHHAKRDYVLSLIKDSYADFGPTLAAEMLAEHHGFKVSRETVRKWMQEDGIWLSRKQRRTFHQPRLRRECFGELIQIDGSDHRWFEDRGDPCTLLVFIDDATSTLDGTAVCDVREYVQLFRGTGKLSAQAWPPGRFLQ